MPKKKLSDMVFQRVNPPDEKEAVEHVDHAAVFAWQCQRDSSL